MNDNNPKTGVRPVARLVTRIAGDDGTTTDLALMGVFRGQTALKPGRIYEIRDIFGDLQIVDVGPSAIGRECADSMLPDLNWGRSVGELVRDNHIYLTREEYQQLLDKAGRAGS